MHDDKHNRATTPVAAVGIDWTQLREHQWALVTIAIALGVWVGLKSLQFFGEHVSALLEELFLTVAVVLAVHVIDHMYLSRGSLRLMQEQLQRLQERIGEQVQPIGDKADESLERLSKVSASLVAMNTSGVRQVYSSRAEADKDMARELRAAGITKIRLIGVSLNDFILENAKAVSGAFREIQARLRVAAGATNPPELDIKVLIIDPHSYGAQQRHRSEIYEDDAPPGRLEHDVMTVAKKLAQFKADLQRAMPEKELPFDCHVYREAPQLFLVWTDKCCFVQQYYCWSSRDAQNAIPVLRFEPLVRMLKAQSADDSSLGKDMHAEMEKHFDWIWKQGSFDVEDLAEARIVGYDMGLCQAAAINVYMSFDASRERIVQLLKGVRPDDTVDVLGISLRSFFADPNPIAGAFRDVLQNPAVTVRILCIDPEGEQATLRSYREALLEDPSLAYDSYCNEGHHQRSKLFRDTTGIIEQLKKLRHDDTQGPNPSDPPTAFNQLGMYKCKFSAWKYKCAPACFMLRVNDVVLFEPYCYGKKDPTATRLVLSGDMPLFEFHREIRDKTFEIAENRNPWALLNDHFDFVTKVSDLVISSL